MLAWGPVLDANFSVPRDSWFQNTFTEKDWHFLPKSPEDLLKEKHFNPELKYMAGVTTQEAAYVICELMDVRLVKFTQIFYLRGTGNWKFN